MTQPIEKLADEKQKFLHEAISAAEKDSTGEAMRVMFGVDVDDHYIKVLEKIISFAFEKGAAAQRAQDRAELERVREALDKMAQTDVTDEVGIVWLTNWRNDTKAAARQALALLTAMLERGK